MEGKNNAGKICKSGEEEIVFKQIYIYHHRATVIDRNFIPIYQSRGGGREWGWLEVSRINMTLLKGCGP